MRAATAYFAGVGTVAVAIAAGLGGGLLLGDIMSPQQPKHPSSEVTRLEQRASPQPIQAMNGASQPVPYLPPAQVAATVAEPPAQQQVSAQPAEPKQQSEASTTTTPQPVATAEPAGARERTAIEDANARDIYAKARDADVKREARRADDRRKAERRQQWADKRKPRQRDGDDLSDVEASVRQATESRPVFGRNEQRPMFGGDSGFGRIKLFDSED